MNRNNSNIEQHNNSLDNQNQQVNEYNLFISQSDASMANNSGNKSTKSSAFGNYSFFKASE